MIYFEEMFYRGQFRGHYSSYFSVEAETKGDSTKESQQEEMATGQMSLSEQFFSV